MSNMTHIRTIAAAAAIAALGCTKDEAPAPTAAASASAAPAAPSVTASEVAPTPSATASALPPRSDCPKGSSGPGTFDHPCEGKGASRLMTVKATGKSDDKGAPQFVVTNKSPRVILYGKIAVYFYDKKGKQLETTDSNGKAHPYKTCGGKIFGGVMKVGEKATISFSCVKKEHVPEGTATMEAEAMKVGFADATEKESEFYWKNDDLVPDARKKGGVK